MNNKLISVIVPVYNSEDCLGQCVDSILSQTYTNLEVLLVDDGSTDSSGNMCDVYAQKDDRIRVIHKSNGGQQDARTAGIAIAQGEFIGFVDSDDWIEREMYETLLNDIGDMDLVTSGIFRHDKAGGIKEIWTDLLPEDVYIGKEKMAYLFDNLFLYRKYSQGAVLGGITNNLVCKLFRASIVREIYQAANIFMRHEEDALFCFLYVLQCEKVRITYSSFYHYMYNPGSVTHSVKSDFWQRRYEYYRIIDQALTGHWMESDLRRQFQKRFMYSALTHMRVHEEIGIPAYTYPDEHELNGKRIVLFGSGRVGRSFYKKMIENQNLGIVLWIDNHPPKEQIMGMKVELPKQLLAVKYDYVICAVIGEDNKRTMKEQLMALGVDENKILWREPVSLYKEILLK